MTTREMRIQPETPSSIAQPADGSSRASTWAFRHSPLIRISGFVLLALSLVGVAPAQQRDPSSLYGRDSLQGVYVRDSAVAVEKFALAERMERLNEWGKAAEVYQELVEQYADRVLPSRVDDQNQIVQYTSAALAVQERLAKWPIVGLEAYRARYEVPARALLEAAPDDPTTLHRVCRIYFPTDTARVAAMKLLDLQIFAGEFAAAAWLGDRLLAWHPNLRDDRPGVLYRTILAYHLVGNTPMVEARLAELRERHPEATAVIRGQTVRLVDALPNDLAGAGIASTAASGENWPMSFGSPARDRVPAVNSDTNGARLFSVPVIRTPPRGPRQAQLRDLENLDRRARTDGFSTGIFPAIDRGELFFQDNARLYAVSVDSGLPLPGWSETYSGDRGGAYTIANAWPTPRGAQLAVCLTDDAVLAIMGQSDRMTMLYAPGAPRDSRLVCLDRRTGRERWSFAARSLAQRQREQRSLELVGTPLVIGNRVYATLKSGAGMQFEQCEVIALDLAQGTLLWRSYVASASTSAQPWDVDPANVADTAPQLSYADGRLYVCTNLGAVASLDGYDGTIVWLNLYPRDLSEFNRLNQLRIQMGRADGEAGQRGRPWSHNPVIVTGNRVFAFPRSSDHVFVYDATSGAELKRVNVRPLDRPDTLVGVVGEKLLVSGPRKITCLDWTKYETGARLDTYRLWANEFEKGGFDDVSIRGRPFVTADSVFVPVQWKLFRINLRTGAVKSAYPPDGRNWGEEEGPGNVVVTQDHLVVAGSERVAVYTDLELARAKLDREVAADPNSPGPRLRYAEVMFVAGKYDVATEKLDEAATLLGGVAALQPGEARDRLFNSALNFARKLMGDSTAPAGAAAPVGAITGFLDRAGTAALSPSQQVSYRVVRARWARTQNDPVTELSLLQELLADPALRSEPVAQADGGGSPTAAGYYAQRAIAELIARHPKAYEPVEQQAQAEYDAVAGAGDPERLLAVAQVYPNSRVASRALLSAADAYESNGNPRQAAAVLRLLLTRPLDPSDRLACVEALARNYLKLPNRLDVAAARLQQAAQLSPQGRLARPLSLPDGKPLVDAETTFADAAGVVKKLRRESTGRSLPRLTLPDVKTDPATVAPFLPHGATVERVTRLIRPQPDATRFDRVVAFRPNDGVMVFNADDLSRPRFVNAATAAEAPPLACAWIGQNLLYATARRVVFVKGDDSGESMWETSLLQIPPVDVVTAEDDPAISSVDEGIEQPPFAGGNGAVAGGLRVNRRVMMLPGGERLIVQNGQQRVLLNARRNAGDIVPPPDAGDGGQPGADEQILHVRCLSDRVIVATTQGRLIALDLSDGQPVWQVRPTDRTIERLLGTDDFVIGIFNDEASMQVVAVDATTGQTVLRRVFSRDGYLPVNVALSPDGKLIWLTHETLVGKDLFDPSDRPTFARTVRGGAGGEGAFGIEPRAADQLLIFDNYIAALADGGQFIRVFSLDDGRPITLVSPELNQALEYKARTDANDWQSNVQILNVGTRVYAVGRFTLRSHDVENPRLSWNRRIDATPRWQAREAAVAASYLLVMEDLLPARRTQLRQTGQTAPALRIAAFNRAPLPGGGEIGRLDHYYEIVEPSGIPDRQYQLVDGGVVYLTGDQKLKLITATGK